MHTWEVELILVIQDWMPRLIPKQEDNVPWTWCVEKLIVSCNIFLKKLDNPSLYHAYKMDCDEQITNLFWVNATKKKVSWNSIYCICEGSIFNYKKKKMGGTFYNGGSGYRCWALSVENCHRYMMHLSIFNLFLRWVGSLYPK